MFGRFLLWRNCLKVNRFNLIRWIAILLIVSSAILTVVQLIRFSRLRAGFSPGTLIAGIPVGGLDQLQAAERITQAFNTPIELAYEDIYVQAKPSSLGFELNLPAMIASADQQRVTLPFWSSFWNYLWNQPFQTSETPLQADIRTDRIRNYLLSEIASRYDQPASISIPIPGTVNFQTGQSGKVLDIESSIPIVERILISPVDRSAPLVISEVAPKRPSLENLEVLIQQIIDRSGYDGLTEVYIMDLKKREDLNFAYDRGVSYDPGIAFTAASTIKIPILVSIFRRMEEPTPQTAADLIEGMIVKSENPPADSLMDIYITPNTGPVFITQDMRELGLENTFLAGQFYFGAPLLQRYVTPANTRLDYTTALDPYNQTTTAELGMILDDIYQCAQTGGGTFAAVFNGEITQSECQLMISYLNRNKTLTLIEAGLPEGTNFANKHGWIRENDGVIRTILHSGIVFSQYGDYILVIAMYQPTQLIFDVANALQAQISQAVYNYISLAQ
jgi:beta-lactamase class A